MHWLYLLASLLSLALAMMRSMLRRANDEVG